MHLGLFININIIIIVSMSVSSQVRAVIRLVEHLCPRLGPAGLSVLYEHLRELPLQYEEMHVELIRNFAEAAGTWATRASSTAGGGVVASLAGECLGVFFHQVFHRNSVHAFLCL